VCVEGGAVSAASDEQSVRGGVLLGVTKHDEEG
jgi:predicted hotdog family 3-hydroxylacyl-ACP dehydratase